jgi:hypothetical protein
MSSTLNDNNNDNTNDNDNDNTNDNNNDNTNDNNNDNTNDNNNDNTNNLNYRKLKILDSSYKICIIEDEGLHDSSFECKEGCIDLPYIKNLFWKPIKNISDIVEKFCNNNNYKNILEIGPGVELFPLATTFIGYNEKIKNYIEIDIDVDKIPTTDKSFDFIYSRHTMEDIQNPDFAMKEIIRCSNSGYVETPSPLVEIMKGIDASEHSSKYAGYIHHRYIVWSDIEKCEIYFLAKNSIILDNFISYNNKELLRINNILNNYPVYWNNYFIWSDKEPKIIMYKNGVNYGLKNNIVEDYIRLVNESINKTIINTNYFIKMYNN